MQIKRFIAGAVCPSCGAMDTIRVFKHEGLENRECVECIYSNVMNVEISLEGQLPETRILREERVLESGTDIIKIIEK